MVFPDGKEGGWFRMEIDASHFGSGGRLGGLSSRYRHFWLSLTSRRSRFGGEIGAALQRWLGLMMAAERAGCVHG